MVERPRERDPYLSFVVAAALALGALLAWQAVERARACGYARDDGIYLQTVWNTAHGRPWVYSLESDAGPPEAIHLASHADLTHPLYVPALWLSGRVETVLVLQPLLVVLGCVPLFLLARRRLGSSAAAAVVAGVGLAFPPLVGNSIHIVGVLLSAPLLLLALERLDAGASRAAAIAFACALATREDVALPVAAFLLPLARDPARRRFALATGGGALAWLLLYTATKGALFGHGPDHLARFSWLGGSLGEIAASPLVHPVAFWGRLLAPDSWRLLALLLLPLGFLPLLSPRHVLAAAAPVALVALSSVDTDRILGRYLIAGIPFLLVGTVEALAWVRTKPQGERTLVPGALLLAAGLTLLAWTSDAGPFASYGGTDGAGHRTGPNLRILDLAAPAKLHALTPEAPAVREVLAALPEDASVSASAPWLILLAHRRRLHPFPVRAAECDFLVIDRRALLNPWPPRSPAEHEAFVVRALAEPGIRAQDLGRVVVIDRRKR